MSIVNLSCRIFSLLLINVFIFSIIPSHALAFDETTTPLKQIKITQETIRLLDGIWILRPKSIDLEIRDIIYSNDINSIEDYAKWLTENIKYKSDGKTDQWARPIDTLLRKFGDCEDYSFLNAYVLKMLGYQPQFMALQRKGQAHAICVFKVEGKYLWFDNAVLKKTSTKTINDFAKLVTKKHRYKYLFELNLDSHDWDLVYKKS